MTPENFATMTLQELRKYLLGHRSDMAAISAYVARISGESGWVTCAALSTPDDLDNYPEFLNKVRRHSV
jgi:hypothetical protein